MCQTSDSYLSLPPTDINIHRNLAFKRKYYFKEYRNICAINITRNKVNGYVRIDHKKIKKVADHINSEWRDKIFRQGKRFRTTKQISAALSSSDNLAPLSSKKIESNNTENDIEILCLVYKNDETIIDQEYKLILNFLTAIDISKIYSRKTNLVKYALFVIVYSFSNM